VNVGAAGAWRRRWQERRNERWHERWQHTGRRWRHSIKARLVALFLLLAVGTAAVFLFGTQRGVQGGWLAYARPLVADYLDRLAADLGTPPDAARAAALVARLPITLRIEGPALQYESHPASPWSSRHRRGASEFDAAAWGLVRTTADGHRITFGLAEPRDLWRARGIGWATLAALLVLTTIAYLAVRRLLAPLADITRGVEAFGRGDFATPIPLRRRDELGDLTTRINAMAASLHGRLEAKRLLLLAISHELRSPLTRARLNAELLPDSAERGALLHDLAEMRDLVADLLESERLAEGHAALHRESTDLAALVRDLVRERFPEAVLELGLDEHIGPREVDPLRLRLALRNLVDNALRHGRAEAAAPVQVFLQRRGEGTTAQIELGVRDHGPGVAAEQLARLGEAFYRPDSARTRASGGVGLGLHLVRLVAQAHGGRLELTPAEPGLRAAIVWPDAFKA
jgi:signal transduction histidine kinase